MNYETVPSEEIIKKTVAAIKQRGVEALIVNDKKEALEKVKSLIPEGQTVMNGSSRTLEQIGFIDYLKSGRHSWNNLHAAIVNEKDPAKQASLRKQAILSDYYLGSVHALAETGEFIIASNSGSQLPHIVFTSPNLIFVVSTKKIVPTLEDAFRRLHDQVVPREDERMKKIYGFGTAPNKVLIFKGENPALGRKVRMILVNEDLGF